MVRIVDLCGRDAQSRLGGAIAVIPLGSLEYHGPHGPLGTDTYLSEYIAEKVAERIPESVLYPAIAFTSCPRGTRAYPGSVDVPAQVFREYLKAVLARILDSGVGGIVLINAHDTNLVVAKDAALDLSATYRDKFVMLFNWWESISPETIPEIGSVFSEDAGHGHGGPLEMSCVAAVTGTAPDLSGVEDLSVVPIEREVPVHVLLDGAPPLSMWRGYHGRVSEISIDFGRKCLDASVDRIAREIRACVASRERRGVY